MPHACRRGSGQQSVSFAFRKEASVRFWPAKFQPAKVIVIANPDARQLARLITRRRVELRCLEARGTVVSARSRPRLRWRPSGRRSSASRPNKLAHPSDLGPRNSSRSGRWMTQPDAVQIARLVAGGRVKLRGRESGVGCVAEAGPGHVGARQVSVRERRVIKGSVGQFRRAQVGIR